MSTHEMNDHANGMPTMGWREWVSLPDLLQVPLKAKIDTGARSSSLHAVNIQTTSLDGRDCVEFDTFPIQKSNQKAVHCIAAIADVRQVRSSSGVSSQRYVIVTSVRWKGHHWNVELTLADRSSMGFRMLLGREAIRKRFLINPGISFMGGRIKKRKST